jgi:hypothetical protein
MLTEIVGNNNYSTGKLVDRLCKGINRFHVQVVGRLIQKQDVGSLECQHGEYNTL